MRTEIILIDKQNGVEEMAHIKNEAKLNTLVQDKLIINTRLHKMKKNALALGKRLQHADHLKHMTNRSKKQITLCMLGERQLRSDEQELIEKVTDDLKTTKTLTAEQNKDHEREVIDMLVQIKKKEERIVYQNKEVIQVDDKIKRNIDHLKAFDHILKNINVLLEMESFLSKLDKMNKEELERVFLNKDLNVKNGWKDLTKSSTFKNLNSVALNFAAQREDEDHEHDKICQS